MNLRQEISRFWHIFVLCVRIAFFDSTPESKVSRICDSTSYIKSVFESIHFRLILITTEDDDNKIKIKTKKLFKFDARIRGQSGWNERGLQNHTKTYWWSSTVACGNLCIYCFPFHRFDLVSVVATLCARVCVCEWVFLCVCMGYSRHV